MCLLRGLMDELTSTTLTLVCKSLLLDALFEPNHVAIFLFLNCISQDVYVLRINCQFLQIQYSSCGTYFLLVHNLIPWDLQGTQAKEKNELLRQEFGIDYNTLPLIFRHGSSVFWEKVSLSLTPQCACLLVCAPIFLYF